MADAIVIRHCLGDFALHRKDVDEVAVVALGPDVIAGDRRDKLDNPVISRFTDGWPPRSASSAGSKRRRKH
jgi:hypothetical protein